jgi:hypothetical protein
MSDPGKPGSEERLNWMVERGVLRHGEDKVDMSKSAKDLENVVDAEFSKLVEKLSAGRFSVGDVVFFDYGYGRITSIASHWRTGNILEVHTPKRESGEEPLFTVKRIDPNTGETMKCPDGRCTESCVICSRNLWADQMRPMGETDEEYFRKEGMLK